MFDFCETPEKLKKFLENIIQDRLNLLTKFDEARDEGSLAYFSQWNGVELIVQNIRAHEAAGALDILENPPESWTKDISIWWYNALRVGAEQRIINPMRINSRTTSMSSNICDDAIRAFYIDLYRATHKAL